MELEAECMIFFSFRMCISIQSCNPFIKRHPRSSHIHPLTSLGHPTPTTPADYITPHQIKSAGVTFHRGMLKLADAL